MLCCMLMTDLMSFSFPHLSHFFLIFSVVIHCLSLQVSYHSSILTHVIHFPFFSQPHFIPQALLKSGEAGFLISLFFLPSFLVTYFCLLVLLSLTQQYQSPHLDYSYTQSTVCMTTDL